MIIAIASGKGGTGKTTVATNLAKTVTGQTVTLMDCDVEEPNAHLFLNPEIREEEPVDIFIPRVDLDRCTHCGKCSELCQFGAIVTIKDKVLVFPELCHSCLGCKRICPVEAIEDDKKAIGTVSMGFSESVRCIYGTLKIGEAMAPPLIQAVKKAGLSKKVSDLSIIDAPPGTSCPVIEAIKNVDFVVLVTEPTPFGLHDLKLAVGMVRILEIPFGIIVNRSTTGDRQVWHYCHKENIPILLEIPDEREIAEGYAIGKLMIDLKPEYKNKFQNLMNKIHQTIASSAKVIA
ncbi:ATP-binding protein [bacterium]|nr:ATP-binding protein [bacterium]